MQIDLGEKGVKGLKSGKKCSYYVNFSSYIFSKKEF